MLKQGKIMNNLSILSGIQPFVAHFIGENEQFSFKIDSDQGLLAEVKNSSGVKTFPLNWEEIGKLPVAKEGLSKKKRVRDLMKNGFRPILQAERISFIDSSAFRLEIPKDKFRCNLASAIQNVTEQLWSMEEHDENLKCPLTFALLKDPVILFGNTFEKEAIKKSEPTCPLTRKNFKSESLQSNRIIKDIIAQKRKDFSPIPLLPCMRGEALKKEDPRLRLDHLFAAHNAQDFQKMVDEYLIAFKYTDRETDFLNMLTYFERFATPKDTRILLRTVLGYLYFAKMKFSQGCFEATHLQRALDLCEMQKKELTEKHTIQENNVKSLQEKVPELEKNLQKAQSELRQLEVIMRRSRAPITPENQTKQKELEKICNNYIKTCKNIQEEIPIAELWEKDAKNQLTDINTLQLNILFLADFYLVNTLGRSTIAQNYLKHASFINSLKLQQLNLDYWNLALRADPICAELYNWIPSSLDTKAKVHTLLTGFIYLYPSHPEDALPFLKKAEGIDPKSPFIKLAYIGLLAKENPTERFKKRVLYSELADLLHADTTASLHYLEKAALIEQDSDSMQLYLDALVKNEQLAKAEHDYCMWIKNLGKRGEAQAHKAMQQLGRSIPLLQTLFDIYVEQNNSVKLIELSGELGKELRLKNQLEEACRVYGTAYKQTLNVELGLERANLLAQLGMIDKSVKAYYKLASPLPVTPEHASIVNICLEKIAKLDPMQKKLTPQQSEVLAVRSLWAQQEKKIAQLDSQFTSQKNELETVKYDLHKERLRRVEIEFEWTVERLRNKKVYSSKKIMQLKDTRQIQFSSEDYLIFQTGESIKVFDLKLREEKELTKAHLFCIIPDGQIACGDKNGKIAILNPKTKKENLLCANDIGVKALSAINSNQLICLLNNNSIQLWDYPVGKRPQNLVKPLFSVKNLIHGNGCVAMLEGSSIRVIDLAYNRHYTLNDNTKDISALHYVKPTENSTGLVSIGADGALRMETHDRKLKTIKTFDAHLTAMAVRFPLVCIGTAAGNIHIWDLQNGIELMHLPRQNSPITHLALSVDGDLVSVTEDGETLLWSHSSSS